MFLLNEGILPGGAQVRTLLADGDPRFLGSLQQWTLYPAMSFHEVINLLNGFGPLGMSCFRVSPYL